MSEPLTPENDPAILELHAFVGAWTVRHKLTAQEELRRLGAYLSGRLNVLAALEKCRAWEMTEEEVTALLE